MIVYYYFLQAYPSLKPLAAWVVDLKKRMDFINNWVDNGIPAVSLKLLFYHTNSCSFMLRFGFACFVGEICPCFRSSKISLPILLLRVGMPAF